MASVSKRKRVNADGTNGDKWIVRSVDRDGKHRQKTFTKKKDADNYRAQIEGERAALGYSYHVEDVTVDKLSSIYSQWWDQRLADGQVKRGSVANINQTIRVSIRPFIGKRKVADITVAAIEDLYRQWRTVRRLSPDTCASRLQQFSAMWEFAKRRGMAKGDNPVKEAIAAIGRPVTPPIRTLNPAEIGRLLEAAGVRAKGQQEQTWRLANVAVNIGAFCGLRIGEILALRVCDVDVNRRLIHVRHTVNHWHELTSPKTVAGNRTVPAPAHVIDLWQAWLQDFYWPNPEGLAFRKIVSRTGNPGAALNSVDFYVAYWRPLVKRAGLHVEGDPLHFHALRHFAASWWLQNALPIADTAKLMGHAHAGVTMRIYSHAMLEDQERSDAIDIMAAGLLARSDAQGLRTGLKMLSHQ